MDSTNPKLYISKEMADKVRYFLKSFKSLEWSGPAWYSHEKDENGFPTNIKLEYWYPLDLGTHGNTDWDGADLMKIFPKLRKRFPKIGKEWVQGNIHSHHNMGAFFSGTDEQQLIDGANENFYYSLVVSTKPGQELAFAVAYPDQFGQVHIVEIEEIETETVTHVDNAWKKEMKWIKKNKKPVTSYSYRGGIGQGALFGEQATRTQEQKLLDEQEALEDYQAWNQSYGIHEDIPISYRQQLEYDEAMLDFERGRIKKSQLKKKLRKIGVDEHGQSLPS